MMRFLPEALTNLSEACLLTDDPDRAKVYAHKCALILWQLAVHYPDYLYEVQSREGKARSTYKGKLFNAIWEVNVPVYCAPAYDAVRPFLPEDDALQAIAGGSAEEIDATIRGRLLTEAARCITDGSRRIIGNYGSHQRALVILAQALNEREHHPTSEEMIRYVVANENVDTYQDLGMRDALENLVYRDGMPFESPGYNNGWVSHMTDVAEALVGVGVNLFETRRFAKLLQWPFDLQTAGIFAPSHGDTGNMFAQGGMWSPDVCRIALPYVKDPRIAWAARSSAGSEKVLFDRPSEELVGDHPDSEEPAIGSQPFHFPAYGLARLQHGENGDATASVLFYGFHGAHMHHDQLNLVLFARRNCLLTDIGYPEQTDPYNHRRFGFHNNTVAHNTVVVDSCKQARGPGILYGYEPNGPVQFVDASCEGAYPGTVSLYRRANLLVKAAPGRSYLFDVFTIHGGTQHDWSVHGTQSDLVCDPPLGPARDQGTLAGADVPYESFYDDPELVDKPLGSVPYTGYTGSGFQFLSDVQEGTLDGTALCDWRLTRPKEGQPERPWEGIGLRAHLIGEDEEILACEGPVQKYDYLPKTVPFLIRRRSGQDLASTFITVFEPYGGEDWIESVSRLTVEPDDGCVVAVRVALRDGSSHVLFHSRRPTESYTVGEGLQVSTQAACLALDESGEPIGATLLNGTVLRRGDFLLEGKGLRRSRIASVDYEAGVVEIEDPILGEDLLPGQTILVAPDSFGDCLTVERRIDATRFSISDEDLQVAGGPITGIDPDRSHIATPVPNPHARVGMTVLNSRMEPQGCLVERDESGWILDRGGLGPLTPDNFPKAAGDETPRFSVVMAAPDDEVLIPHLAQFSRA
jgi:hypothetical protein